MKIQFNVIALRNSLSCLCFLILRKEDKASSDAVLRLFVCG
jgi:hypothetical protein